MKILVISHNCVLATSQERMAEFARLAGDKPVLLVPPRNLEAQGMVELERDSDERYEIVRGRPLFSSAFGQRYLQYYPFLSLLFRRVRPDLIDVHEEPWSLTAFQAVLSRRLAAPRAKVVVESEQNVFKRFPPPFSFFERRVLRVADAMIARNEEVAAVLRRKGFERKIIVVPNGIDLNTFRRTDSAETRRRLGLKNFVAAYLGRLVREKGVDDLIRAASMLDAAIDLLIVGDGPCGGELRALAASLPLRGAVVWRPAVPQRGVPDLLSCADALVLPSRTIKNWKEQFGRILVEAMACGVPVVASDSGAIPEVVGDAGLIFREGDVQGLRNALDSLIGSRDLREELIRKGLQRARERYSWVAAAAAMMSLFRELVPP
ncbi:MAG: glycosyltransferase [bacterium]